MEEKKIEEEVVEESVEEVVETPEEPVEEDVEVEGEPEPEPEEEKCECYSIEPPKHPWKTTFTFGTFDCKLCGRRVKA